VLGVQVHLIDRNERVLSHLPEPIAKVIAHALAADGVTMHLGSNVNAVSYRDGRHTIRCANDDEIITDALLLAAGHRPATHALDCSLSNLTLDDQGYVQVNAQLQTNIEGVSAIGSCIDQHTGQSSSYEDHLRLIDQWGLGADKNHKTTRRRQDRPRAFGLFTHPQVGHVGQFHDEAELAGYRVAHAQQALSDTALCAAAPSYEGFSDILIDEPSGKILGVTLVGNGAAEVATMLAPLLSQHRTWQDLMASPMIPGTWGQQLQNLARQFR